MNYWLICLPRPDLEHCIKMQVFGLARKHVIEKVRTGDQIVCCAGKGDWKIIATGNAISDYYVDDQNIFLKPGHFIDRFKFNANNCPNELDLMSIIGQLTFIKNLAYWAVHFRNGIAKISPNDWELITNSLAKAKLDS